MKVLCLGAGLQGSACAYDLAVREGLEITIADRDGDAVGRAAAAIGTERVGTAVIDVEDRRRMRDLMARHDGVVSAVPYFWNPTLTTDAIEAGVHFTDMGGNTDLVRQQLGHHENALEKGVSIVPDMGLAPGLANVLAAHLIESFQSVESVAVRVGGLPVHPKPPLGYMMLFSMHGLINEYVGEALVLRQGKVHAVPTFCDVETLEVEGIGELEAFPTLGGISTLPYTYEGRVREMDYRTIRYPGHYAKMKCILELGLLDDAPIEVEGRKVVPRDVFAACAEPRLTHPGEPDLVIVRVTVAGKVDGRPCFLRRELVERGDPATGHTAMMRTTGYPVAIVAAMQARGEIAPGALPPERAVPGALFLERLAARGIRVRD